ncbi:MAG: hypothetical protein VKJ64_07235 [Leptolyngbyaceae bacterium]|nr:hypothetical protein [Leptolyngbyaceae bacterium]
MEHNLNPVAAAISSRLIQQIREGNHNTLPLGSLFIDNFLLESSENWGGVPAARVLHPNFRTGLLIRLVKVGRLANE